MIWGVTCLAHTASLTCICDAPLMAPYPEASHEAQRNKKIESKVSAPESKLQGQILITACICLCNAALQQPSDHSHIKHGQLPEPMLRCPAATACRDSQVMQRALDKHDTVLRALLARDYGYEVTTEGDSFTMAFHDPVDAVLPLHPPLCTSLYPGCSF